MGKRAWSIFETMLVCLASLLNVITMLAGGMGSKAKRSKKLMGLK